MKKARKPTVAAESGPPRALLYCRVSTRRQTDNLSLPEQRARCTAFCEQNGWSVERVFVDKGASAKTADRPALMELLEYVKTHPVSYVVVYDLTRYMRNTHEHWAVRAVLAAHGVQLRSVTQAIDESATGKLMEGILASFSTFDNDQRRDKTINGMKARVEAGGWPFMAPIGYLKQRGENGPTLTIDPEKAPLIREAFELMATGCFTKTQVLASVTKGGLRTRRGAPLSTQTFFDLLNNGAYAGWLSVPSWNLKIRGTFQPIVPDDLFAQVQRVLSGKSPIFIPKERNNAKFPLRGFVRCGCGSMMTASTSTGRNGKFDYYRCTRCAGKNVRAKYMEDRFMALLERLKPRPDHMKLFTAIVEDVWHRKQAEARAQRQALQIELRTETERRDRAFNLYVDGRLGEDTYRAQEVRLNEHIARLTAEIDQLEPKPLDIKAVLRFADSLTTHAASAWRRADLDQRQRLQSTIFPDGVVCDGGSVGTTKTSLFFSRFATGEIEKTSLVDQTGIEPARGKRRFHRLHGVTAATGGRTARRVLTLGFHAPWVPAAG